MVTHVSDGVADDAEVLLPRSHGVRILAGRHTGDLRHRFRDAQKYLREVGVLTSEHSYKMQETVSLGTLVAVTVALVTSLLYLAWIATIRSADQIAGVVDLSSACRQPLAWEVLRSYSYADPACAEKSSGFL